MSGAGTFAVAAVLLIPAFGAALLALLPDDRTSARLNVLASLSTFAFSLVLLVKRPAPGPFLIVDDLNVVFIVLSTFVAFTTSVFSASYIAHELDTGRLTPAAPTRPWYYATAWLAAGRVVGALAGFGYFAYRGALHLEPASATALIGPPTSLQEALAKAKPGEQAMRRLVPVGRPQDDARDAARTEPRGDCLDEGRGNAGTAEPVVHDDVVHEPRLFAQFLPRPRLDGGVHVTCDLVPAFGHQDG